MSHWITLSMELIRPVLSYSLVIKLMFWRNLLKNQLILQLLKRQSSTPLSDLSFFFILMTQKCIEQKTQHLPRTFIFTFHNIDGVLSVNSASDQESLILWILLKYPSRN